MALPLQSLAVPPPDPLNAPNRTTSMSSLLKDLPVGSRARVAGYNSSGQGYRRKLLAMGFTPGIELTVVRVAPMGDPVEVRVRDSSVSLRKVEADALQVELIADGL
jgi:ferrous iron transport protein A